jgi:hypothetical protein
MTKKSRIQRMEKLSKDRKRNKNKNLLKNLQKRENYKINND